MAKKKTKLLVKIPLDDYLSSGKTIEKGQILYYQWVEHSTAYTKIHMKPIVYLRESKTKNFLYCIDKQDYIDNKGRGISYITNVLFIEVEAII